jgi:hypothetical protein
MNRGHIEHSPRTNLEGAHGFMIHVESPLGKGVAAILIAGVIAAILLGGMAFMSAQAAKDEARKAERESRLQRLETDEMNVRLKLAGIPEHQPGDKP